MARRSSRRKKSVRRSEPLATYIVREGDSNRWRVFSVNPVIPDLLPAGYGSQPKGIAETVAKGLAEETGGQYKGELCASGNQLTPIQTSVLQ